MVGIASSGIASSAGCGLVAGRGPSPVEVVVLLDAVRPAPGVVVPQETLREPQPVATAEEVDRNQSRGHYADEQARRTDEGDRHGRADDGDHPDPIESHDGPRCPELPALTWISTSRRLYEGAKTAKPGRYPFDVESYRDSDSVEVGVDIVMVVLRVLHIAAGVFWVGAAFAFFLFVDPSAKALGPDVEGKFLDQITRVRRFPMVILSAGLITVLAGLAMYYRDSNGFSNGWIGTPTGIGFTIGGLAAIVSFLTGPLVILPTIKKLQGVGGRLEAEHRPPTPEEGAELAALDQRLTTIGKIDLVFLSVAVLFMATSRYL